MGLSCNIFAAQSHPEFPRFLWEYNEWVAWFSKGILRILMWRGYAMRDKLLGCAKAWHRYAAEQTRRS